MTFIENKYTTWYFSIINRAKNRPVIGYVENHHIIPKSIGGDNTINNLVSLTAKEHFICHLLLIKMLDGKNKAKMVYAAWQLANQENFYQNRFKITGSTYSHIREEFSKTHSTWMKENRHILQEKVNKYWTDENRKIHADKISKATKGHKKSEKAKESYRNKVWTERALKNLKEIGIKSAALRKGKPWSEEKRNSQLNSYYNKNLNLAITVLNLTETTNFTINAIAKELKVDWLTIKTIISRQAEFRKRINDLHQGGTR